MMTVTWRKNRCRVFRTVCGGVTCRKQFVKYRRIVIHGTPIATLLRPCGARVGPPGATAEPVLPLQGAAGHAGDDVALGEDVEQHQWRGGDRDGRRDQGPLGGVLREELEQPGRDRLDVSRWQE